MASKRILLIQGLKEFVKLDSGPAPTYKCVVERAVLNVGRKPLVAQTKNESKPALIVRVTPQCAMLCQLLPGEVAPEYLPRAFFAYL